MPAEYISSTKLPTQWGEFAAHAFVDSDNGKEHLLLTYGSVEGRNEVLTRIHSECLTGDALFSLRCDCGAQLRSAMEKIVARGHGVIFYLRQEGRGIGLANKIRAYKLQDEGADTVQANIALGFSEDMREYSVLKPMFEFLKLGSVVLMTNNPRKIVAIEKLGLKLVTRQRHEVGCNNHNINYLNTKRSKLGHLFSDLTYAGTPTY
jgi:GTP cyclohydrolase II